MWHQWVAGKVHLGHQPAAELTAEEREVDVGRAPRIAVVLPGIRAGLDGDEAIATVVVGQAPTRPREVGVERRRMLVILVEVAAGSIRLPDLHDRLP